MKLTRQHFEAFADVIHRARTAVVRTGDSHVVDQYDVFFIPLVAKELSATNPAFDPERFIEACENGLK